MTAFTDNQVRSALSRKGFKKENTHHKYYYFYDDEGKRTSVRTYVSHSGHDIGDSLIKKMAHQTHLEKKQFEQFIECTLSKEKYCKLLKEKGII